MSKVNFPTVRELVILDILVEADMYGSQIQTKYENKANESFTIGSLYVTLRRMYEKDYLTFYKLNKCIYYRSTKVGKEKLNNAKSVLLN